MLSSVDKNVAPLAVIMGLSGPVLSDEEHSFFQEINPLGFILFARNCENPEQMKALVASLHECMGREVPILIDQEGGRVQRLRAPLWTDYPAAQSLNGDLNAVEKMYIALGSELAANGVNVDCAPVLDVSFPETHDVIGDRAFGDTPETVASCGGAVCEALFQSGVVPIIKHIPGHGRAQADSHLELPVVTASRAELEATDFEAFRTVCVQPYGPALWGMTAHVVYEAIDPDAPITCSPAGIADVIRGTIGFDGLLLSDDVSMEALGTYGDVGARTRAVLDAGCDIALHCNGDMAEMREVAAGAKKMTNEAVMRYNRSVSWVKRNFEND